VDAVDSVVRFVLLVFCRCGCGHCGRGGHGGRWRLHV